MPDCDHLRNSAGDSVQTKPRRPKLNGQAMHFALRFVRRPRLTRWNSRHALSGAAQDRLRPIRGEKICV